MASFSVLRTETSPQTRAAYGAWCLSAPRRLRRITSVTSLTHQSFVLKMIDSHIYVYCEYFGRTSLQNWLVYVGISASSVRDSGRACVRGLVCVELLYVSVREVVCECVCVCLGPRRSWADLISPSAGITAEVNAHVKKYVC